ncbi:MAG: hypothetical protein ACI82S_003369, partial [Patiriisocius sp.]
KIIGSFENEHLTNGRRLVPFKIRRKLLKTDFYRLIPIS